MLAIALRLSLLCELLIYGVFASRALSLAPAASALAACAVLLGLRAGIIAVTYVFAYAAHSPAHDLPQLFQSAGTLDDLRLPLRQNLGSFLNGLGAKNDHAACAFTRLSCRYARSAGKFARAA